MALKPQTTPSTLRRLMPTGPTAGPDGAPPPIPLAPGLVLRGKFRGMIEGYGRWSNTVAQLDLDDGRVGVISAASVVKVLAGVEAPLAVEIRILGKTQDPKSGLMAWQTEVYATS